MHVVDTGHGPRGYACLLLPDNATIPAPMPYPSSTNQPCIRSMLAAIGTSTSELLAIGSGTTLCPKSSSATLGTVSDECQNMLPCSLRSPPHMQACTLRADDGCVGMTQNRLDIVPSQTCVILQQCAHCVY